MKPLFSVIHATRGRPEKACAAMRMWRDRAVHPEAVEYLICTDADDDTRFKLNLGVENTRGYGAMLWIEHPGSGSASAWDFAAKFSRGDIIIQSQDDLEPPQAWDEDIHSNAMLAGTSARPWNEVPLVLAVSDGYRKDALLCTAIMNRARYKQQGEFLHAGYHSVFSDDEHTYRSIKDCRDGKCCLINARHLTFLHRHHYHDPSVPFDSTYAGENSGEAYAKGRELFYQRNPEAAHDGLKTW